MGEDLGEDLCPICGGLMPPGGYKAWDERNSNSSRLPSCDACDQREREVVRPILEAAAAAILEATTAAPAPTLGEKRRGILPLAIAPWAEAFGMLVAAAVMVLVLSILLTVASEHLNFIVGTGAISAVLIVLFLFDTDGSLLDRIAVIIGALLVPGIFVWAGEGNLVAGGALTIIVTTALGLGGFFAPMLLSFLLSGCGVRIPDGLGNWIVAACFILGFGGTGFGLALTHGWH